MFAAMTSLIEFKGTTKSYGGPAGRAALDNLSLRVDKAEFTAIMGPSGSGRSPLLHVVAGVDHASSGSVVVDGHDLSRLSEADLARFRRSRIGFVFQFFHLLNNLCVLDNVLIAAQLAGAGEAASRTRAHELLGELGIIDKVREYPAKLSGGQRQRVGLPRAPPPPPPAPPPHNPPGPLSTT